MAAMVRSSHSIYKRYQSTVEALITGIGLGFLVSIVLSRMPVYPPNWAPVLVALVALIGFRWPMAAYLLAALVVLYPIYTLSLYLAVLFLAITILMHRSASYYLGATVLILLAPLLANYHLHWSIPILAGLWWGATNGFWISGAAAFWGKLLGGMSGIDIDWLTMAGQVPSIAGLMQRYNGLGSLETLTKLVQPLAPDTTMLLYHLLQVAVWALVAGFVGSLAQQKWLHYRYPWSILGISAIGITALGAGHLFLTIWLKGTDPTTLNYDPIVMVVIISLMVSSTLAIIRQSLELPVAPQVRKRVISVPVSRTEPKSKNMARTLDEQPQTKPAPVPLPDLPEWKPPEDDNDDLILLELD